MAPPQAISLLFFMMHSYSKFTFEDLRNLGVEVVIGDLFVEDTMPRIEASEWLKAALAYADKVSLDTEKARSEFLIAPVLRELQQKNPDDFAVYSGFNFDVDKKLGLQGFCDYLLAKLPLKIVPDTPIIAVVEAKLNASLSAAVPQCAAEMYATRIWNEKRGEKLQTIYGCVTTGDNWMFLRYKEGNLIEVDKNPYSLKELSLLLGIWQHIINQYK